MQAELQWRRLAAARIVEQRLTVAKERRAHLVDLTLLHAPRYRPGSRNPASGQQLLEALGVLEGADEGQVECAPFDHVAGHPLHVFHGHGVEACEHLFRVGCASLEDLARIFRASDGDGQWEPQRLRQGGYDAFAVVRRKVDVGPSLVSRVFDCRGPSIGIASACAAGGQAIGEAYRLIRSGRADAAIAGGCEASLTYVGLSGFILLKALTERYSAPATASRPFDRKRSGFVISEGAGALVLEDLVHARDRGAPILGELLGYGDSTDAYRITDIQCALGISQLRRLDDFLARRNEIAALYGDLLGPTTVDLPTPVPAKQRHASMSHCVEAR